MKNDIENEIKLSFCISTYNRVSGIVRLVNDILCCPDEDIEIVVLDNASTDETYDELGKIKDPRLKYFKNGTNKGALHNMVHVLEKGRGQFLVFSTDKDFIDSKKIPAFKSFLLNTPDLAAGFCCFENQDKPVRHIFSRGAVGVKNIAYKSRHPTGYFFKGDYLRNLELSKKFSDYNVVDLFPLEFALAELCILGKSAIFEGNIFKPASGKPPKGQKSLTTDGNSENAFFTPKSRLKMSINYTKHCATLNLPFASKLIIAADLFSSGLMSATFGYKSIMKNENLCLHYNMKKQVISLHGIIKISLFFIWGYLKGILKDDRRNMAFALLIPICLLQFILSLTYSKIKKVLPVSLK